MGPKKGEAPTDPTPEPVEEEKGPEPVPPSTLDKLLRAAETGDEGGVRSRVTEKSVNLCDPVHGLSLLSWASTGGHVGVVELLLQMGAATEVADREGYTPLHRASWNGHGAVVRALAKGGARIGATAIKDGALPVGLAAARGHLEVVSLFVRELGLGVDEKDRRGMTPLAMASAAGQLEVVEWLLSEGADSGITSASGDTARSLSDRAAAHSRTRVQQQTYREIISMLSAGRTVQSAASVL
eukprot:Hpha_TRINITY_DN1714_c0_g1::TRINITY_DN1714_c0_g1_i1::g.158600::m.158600